MKEERQVQTLDPTRRGFRFMEAQLLTAATLNAVLARIDALEDRLTARIAEVQEQTERRISLSDER